MSCKGQYSDSFTNRQIFRTHIRHKYTFLTHSHAFRPSRQRMRTHLGQQDGAGTGAVHLACVQVRHPQSTEQKHGTSHARSCKPNKTAADARTLSPNECAVRGFSPAIRQEPEFSPVSRGKIPCFLRAPSTAEFCGDAPARLQTRWLRAPSRMEAADVPDTKTPASKGGCRAYRREEPVSASRTGGP